MIINKICFPNGVHPPFIVGYPTIIGKNKYYKVLKYQNNPTHGTHHSILTNRTLKCIAKNGHENWAYYNSTQKIGEDINKFYQKGMNFHVCVSNKYLIILWSLRAQLHTCKEINIDKWRKIHHVITVGEDVHIREVHLKWNSNYGSLNSFTYSQNGAYHSKWKIQILQCNKWIGPSTLGHYNLFSLAQIPNGNSIFQLLL